MFWLTLMNDDIKRYWRRNIFYRIDSHLMRSWWEEANSKRGQSEKKRLREKFLSFLFEEMIRRQIRRKTSRIIFHERTMTSMQWEIANKNVQCKYQNQISVNKFSKRTKFHLKKMSNINIEIKTLCLLNPRLNILT